MLAAAFVMAVAAAVIVGVSQRTERDEPAPTPGIVTHMGEIRTVPEVPDERRDALGTDLGVLLKAMYERAFFTAQGGPELASPKPGQLIGRFFTTTAREALRERMEVFQSPDLDVAHGTVSFNGLLTLEGEVPVQSLLEVDFVATAAPSGRTTPLVRLRQRGTLVLTYESESWLVEGFDLRLRTRPLATPEPSP